MPPLHLACIANMVFDSFPVKNDMNFSKEFGLESESFNILDEYLTGNNVVQRKMPLNFPVFLTVTPKSNSTVERAICIWLSEFSSLVKYLHREKNGTHQFSIFYRYHQKWTGILASLKYHNHWMIE